MNVTTATRGYLCRRRAFTPPRYPTQPIQGCVLILGTTWLARIIFTRFSARRIPGTSTAKAITMADKRKGLSRARDDPRPWARYRKLARENIASNWEETVRAYGRGGHAALSRCKLRWRRWTNYHLLRRIMVHVATVRSQIQSVSRRMLMINVCRCPSKPKLGLYICKCVVHFWGFARILD